MQLLGISEQEIERVPLEKSEEFYSMAFALYEQGDYVGASELFTRLVLTDPFAQHYWRGLASAKQMAQEYRDALHAWSLVCLLCEQDPEPHFHAAGCLLSLNEKDDALKALEAAEKRCTEEMLRSKILVLKQIHYANKD